MKKIIEETEPVDAPFPKHHRHTRSFFWPLFLIILGALLLLNNFGVLPWTIWDTLWKFWPLILILIGLEILLGKSRAANILVTLIGIILLFTILSTNIPELNTWIGQSASQLHNFTSSPSSIVNLYGMIQP